MFQRTLARLSIGLLLCSAALTLPGWPQPPREKTIWNYDGGLLLVNDGAIPNGPCFRMTGRVTSGHFFDNLRRVDTTSGTLYRRGHDVITEFPEMLRLSFVLYDRPCMEDTDVPAKRTYLTKETMRTLRLAFYWKRGMELRPAAGIVRTHAEARLIPPYASELAQKLPEIYEWWFDFDVPSAGVPLTDSLVLIMTTPDNRIVTRAAARM